MLPAKDFWHPELIQLPGCLRAERDNILAPLTHLQHFSVPRTLRLIEKLRDSHLCIFLPI